MKKVMMIAALAAAWYPANQKELRTMTPSPWTKV